MFIKKSNCDKPIDAYKDVLYKIFMNKLVTFLFSFLLINFVSIKKKQNLQGFNKLN